MPTPNTKLSVAEMIAADVTRHAPFLDVVADSMRADGTFTVVDRDANRFTVKVTANHPAITRTLESDLLEDR